MVLDLNRLKRERIARGLTQQEIAKRMGWQSSASYARREKGLVNIGAGEFVEIIEILGYKREDIKLFFNL